MTDKPKPREVEIVKPAYQLGKAELEAEMRVDAAFDEAVDALMKPIRIRYTDRSPLNDAFLALLYIIPKRGARER